MGGRLRFLISGGAPLSAETQKWFGVCLGCPVLQGYGLTETCAGGTLTHSEDRQYGHVGAPVGCTEIKLVDVPDMGYTSHDTNSQGLPTPRGEICMRGANVTSGYYKLPEKTAEAFVESKDGGVWFHTGDIGMWTPEGNLKIIDRVKDLVKLSHGEYVALGRLESQFRASEYVDEIMVYADSLQSYVIALVNPNEARLMAEAKARNLSGDLASLLRNADLKQAVLDSLKDISKKAKHHKYEYVAKIDFTEQWTPQNQMLTEAFKLKRNNIVGKYEEKLDALYA